MLRTKTVGQNYVWFALVDAEQCRLLICRLTESDTQHVDECDVVKNPLLEQEHARPMTHTGTTHYVEENERHFAGEIVRWLQKKAEEQKIDHLVILAPPRMLGAIRKVPLGLLKGRVEELKGDLMRLEPGELAKHPMIHDLMAATHEV